MAEAETTPIDRERVERQLRSVRTKLLSARRNQQTLVRQSGMAQGRHRMEQEIGRAEQLVEALAQTEATLKQQLDGATPAATAAEGVTS